MGIFPWEKYFSEMRYCHSSDIILDKKVREVPEFSHMGPSLMTNCVFVSPSISAWLSLTPCVPSWVHTTSTGLLSAPLLIPVLDVEGMA